MATKRRMRLERIAYNRLRRLRQYGVSLPRWPDRTFKGWLWSSPKIRSKTVNWWNKTEAKALGVSRKQAARTRMRNNAWKGKR